MNHPTPEQVASAIQDTWAWAHGKSGKSATIAWVRVMHELNGIKSMLFALGLAGESEAKQAAYDLWSIALDHMANS